MTCQQCGDALAEWKVREVNSYTGEIIRWWYVCDVCCLMVYAPWIGRSLPTVPAGQVWRSSNGGQVAQNP